MFTFSHLEKATTKKRQNTTPTTTRKYHIQVQSAAHNFARRQRYGLTDYFVGSKGMSCS